MKFSHPVWFSNPMGFVLLLVGKNTRPCYVLFFLVLKPRAKAKIVRV